MPMSSGQQDANALPLNGHVATMRFSVEVGYSSQLVELQRTSELNTIDEAVARELNLLYEQISEIIKTQVATTLGQGFEVESVVIRAGSIEILAIIAATSVFLGNYNDFTKQLNTAIENTRTLLRSLISAMRVVSAPLFAIQGSWFPGSALANAREQVAAQPSAQTAPVTVTNPVDRGQPWSSSRLLLSWALLTDILLLAILVVLLLAKR